MSSNTTVFEGGGGQIPDPEPFELSEFIDKRKATIDSFLLSCGRNAVGIEITIRNSDGTCMIAKLN